MPATAAAQGEQEHKLQRIQEEMMRMYMRRHISTALALAEYRKRAAAAGITLTEREAADSQSSEGSSSSARGKLLQAGFERLQMVPAPSSPSAAAPQSQQRARSQSRARSRGRSKSRTAAKRARSEVREDGETVIITGPSMKSCLAYERPPVERREKTEAELRREAAGGIRISLQGSSMPPERVEALASAVANPEGELGEALSTAAVLHQAELKKLEQYEATCGTIPHYAYTDFAEIASEQADHCELPSPSSRPAAPAAESSPLGYVRREVWSTPPIAQTGWGEDLRVLYGALTITGLGIDAYDVFAGSSIRYQVRGEPPRIGLVQELARVAVPGVGIRDTVVVKRYQRNGAVVEVTEQIDAITPSCIVEPIYVIEEHPGAAAAWEKQEGHPDDRVLYYIKPIEA
eukprot:TRINITY_DN12171_c0_g1_i3.p1 TRINITY_DN12171_c0_g1~~TRINITY_DN12171_c0_g1_i3.p1  ORF type:complete len:405 (+),score=150.94 TRINITY_DN12171_c0_g1_i3:86-1300(+)